MSRVLVIGCGGVASVAIQKCCQADEVFTELCIASRTKEKCDALAEKLRGKTKTVLTTAKVDADDVDQLIELINDYKPDLLSVLPSHENLHPVALKKAIPLLSLQLNREYSSCPCAICR